MRHGCFGLVEGYVSERRTTLWKAFAQAVDPALQKPLYLGEAERLGKTGTLSLALLLWGTEILPSGF